MQTSTTKGVLMAPWHTIRGSHHMWWLPGLTKYSHRWLCVPEKNQAPLRTHFLKHGRRKKEIKNQPVIQEQQSAQFWQWRAARDPEHGGCSSFLCGAVFLPTTETLEQDIAIEGSDIKVPACELRSGLCFTKATLQHALISQLAAEHCLTPAHICLGSSLHPQVPFLTLLLFISLM